MFAVDTPSFLFRISPYCLPYPNLKFLVFPSQIVKWREGVGAIPAYKTVRNQPFPHNQIVDMARAPPSRSVATQTDTKDVRKVADTNDNKVPSTVTHSTLRFQIPYPPPLLLSPLL